MSLLSFYLFIITDHICLYLSIFPILFYFYFLPPYQLSNHVYSISKSFFHISPFLYLRFRTCQCANYMQICMPKEGFGLIDEVVDHMLDTYF